MIDLNITQAAIRAGYSRSSAAGIGSDLLKKAHIAALVAKLQAELAERANVSALSVVRELALCGFSNMADYVQPDGTYKGIHELTREQAAAVQELKLVETKAGSLTANIKLVDKRASLVDLGRHLGIFEADNKQVAEAIAKPEANLSTARLIAFAIRKAASQADSATLEVVSGPDSSAATH